MYITEAVCCTRFTLASFATFFTSFFRPPPTAKQDVREETLSNSSDVRSTLFSFFFCLEKECVFIYERKKSSTWSPMVNLDTTIVDIFVRRKFNKSSVLPFFLVEEGEQVHIHLFFSATHLRLYRQAYLLFFFRAPPGIAS